MVNGAEFLRIKNSVCFFAIVVVARRVLTGWITHAAANSTTIRDIGYSGGIEFERLIEWVTWEIK